MTLCFLYSNKWGSGGNKFGKGEPNINLSKMLEIINRKEQKMKSTYTRDFGTYIGRFRPRSNGISGSVSRG